MVGEEGQRIVGLYNLVLGIFWMQKINNCILTINIFFLNSGLFRGGQVISSTEDQTQTLKAYSSSKNTNEIEII